LISFPHWLIHLLEHLDVDYCHFVDYTLQFPIVFDPSLSDRLLCLSPTQNDSFDVWYSSTDSRGARPTFSIVERDLRDAKRGWKLARIAPLPTKRNQFLAKPGIHGISNRQSMSSNGSHPPLTENFGSFAITAVWKNSNSGWGKHKKRGRSYDQPLTTMAIKDY
jgi:hypothetical protein